jgi:hypothetical protein
MFGLFLSIILYELSDKKGGFAFEFA